MYVSQVITAKPQLLPCAMPNSLSIMNVTGNEAVVPFNLTEIDRQVLTQTDLEFDYHDWENLRDIISKIADFSARLSPPLPLTSHADNCIQSAHNDLAALKRKPSDLKRYIAWSTRIKAEYGSITNYICQRRLRWHEPEPGHGVLCKNDASSSTKIKPQNNTTGNEVATAPPIIQYRNPVPFADPSDYKILRNDWPYGVAPGITHLCVWVKSPIAIKAVNGDLTQESRMLIEDFVNRTFVEKLAERILSLMVVPEQTVGLNGVVVDMTKDQSLDWAKERVLWFKNWSALQSVRSLEHIHVLVRDVPDSLITEWTGDYAPVR
jgi:hypothetical protein